MNRTEAKSAIVTSYLLKAQAAPEGSEARAEYERLAEAFGTIIDTAPAGAQGPTGPAGPQGERGPMGPCGRDADPEAYAIFAKMFERYQPILDLLVSQAFGAIQEVAYNEGVKEATRAEAVATPPATATDPTPKKDHAYRGTGAKNGYACRTCGGQESEH